MRRRLYFCVRLTENEHCIFQQNLEKKCREFELDLHYYRQLQEGEVPMIREVKLSGENLKRIQGWMKEEKMVQFIEPNPHSLARRSISGTIDQRKGDNDERRIM